MRERTICLFKDENELNPYGTQKLYSLILLKKRVESGDEDCLLSCAGWMLSRIFLNNVIEFI